LAALGLAAPIVAGFDWGGLAALVAAALWPQQIRALVTVSGYNVQNIPAAARPVVPEFERRLWYQYHLHGERGQEGLRAYRREFARLLWQEWSPGWTFTDDEFDATAISFDNPDFVDVVVNSYRHRYELARVTPLIKPLKTGSALNPPLRCPR
jgi:pimeloyl-ACP methyl ester carboxylesterase